MKSDRVYSSWGKKTQQTKTNKQRKKHPKTEKQTTDI